LARFIITTRSLFPQIKQRSPLTTHKTRSPISSNQTAIALHHPTPDRLNLNNKQRSPLHHPQTPIAYFPHQKAIATHHPQTPIAYSPNQKAIALIELLKKSLNQISHNFFLLASGIYSNIHEEVQYLRIFFLFGCILLKHLDTELKNVQLLKDYLFQVY
jgi:hypothetical protein